MVYNLYNGTIIESSYGKKVSTFKSHATLNFQTESLSAKVILKTIKLFLYIYDFITLAIYFIIQRPDRRAKDAQKIRSERVDINTWIKTDQNSLIDINLYHNEKQRRNKLNRRYMGSTVSDIFSNSVQEFKTKPCLGYRAVVTCPVLSINDEGKHVLQDKSFRSDYTWYTYEQVGRRVQDIASGLYANQIYPNSRAFFYANTSLEWFLASQACFQLAIELVLAPEISDLNSILLILKETEVSIMFISCDRLLQLVELFKQMKSKECSLMSQIKKIVITDWLFTIDYSEPTFAELKQSNDEMSSKMVSLGQVEESGVENPIKLSCTKYVEGVETNVEEFISITREEKKKSRVKIGQRINSKLFSNNNLTVVSAKDQISQSNDCEAPLTVPLKRKLIGQVSSQSSNQINQMNKQQSNNSLTSSCISAVDLNNIHVFSTEKPTKPDDIAMIVYSHGRLGDLKAVMLSHYYLSRSNHYSFLDEMISVDDLHCTTLNLDNVIEFMIELCIFSHGGSIGYSSNNRTLFYDGKDLFKRDLSDLQALDPTILLVRPYILESLRSSIQNYIQLQYNPLKGFLLTNLIYEYKKFWARRHFRTPIVDRIFCKELQNLFGKRLNFILCNGATDCQETKDFFAFMVNIPVVELYGTDEAIVSLISVNDIWDYKRRKVKQNNWSSNSEYFNGEPDEEDFPDMQLMPPKVDKNNAFREDSSKNLLITSSILCPTLNTRIRLEDWEDFRTSDLPYPRGRVIIGGNDLVICRGYFNRETSTKMAFYQDSNYITWFRTDDIARVFPNGSFEIISNLSDIIKLTDGQFISLSQIEHILRNSQFVDNVCAICGDDRKFIIALVVPNLRRLALKSPGEADLKMAMGMEPEAEELVDIEFRREVCNDRLLCEFVTKHLNELIVKAGFQAIPNRFHLVPEIWTPETELVTPSFEPKRSAIQSFYATDIQSIVKLEFGRSSSKRLSARKLNKLANSLHCNTFTSIGGRLSC